MSYIGRGVDAISNVEKLDNITFNGGTTYALTKSSAAFTPVGANNILISIDGVIQQGNFSVSTTNIVFDWSPTSSNTCNFILHYGTGVLNVPADGSIVAAKMAANSVDSDSYVDGSIDAVHLSANSVDSDAYVDGSIDTAHIGATQVTGAKLNTDVISAQTALAVAPADTDEFMVSDGGVLKRVDYSYLKGGDNTPSFFAYLSGDQDINDSTMTKITLDTEYYDTDSAFASNKFTVPTDEGGKYLFVYGIGMDNMTDGQRGIVKIAVNGTGIEWGVMQQWHSASSQSTYMTASVIRTLVATDYVELYGYQSSGGALGIQSNKTFLSGLKILGA